MTDLLAQSPAAIEAVQNARLHRMLALCARGHAYYQRSWAAAGADPTLIRSVRDLARLPLTTKAALMAEPEAFRLHVPDLPLPERALWEVIYTTGSTGDPTPIYSTTHDYHAYLMQARRVADISGITDRDVIANLFPLTPAPMGAFVRTAANAYAAGAAVVAALSGAPQGDFAVHRPLDDAVRLIERHRATVLWGVTSFVRRVLLRAAALGADFSRVRMCAVTGEASSPAMRAELRQGMRNLHTAGAIVFDRYGATEFGGLAQCREDGEWHNPAPEILYLEVVDPTTGARLPDGARGALAITHLDRRGTVLLRFVVGDIVSIARAPCPHCGRAGERVIGPVVRSGDLVKVKGMLINPDLLLAALSAIAELDEFQVVVRRQDTADPFAMDDLVVRAATVATDRNGLARRIIADAAAAVGVRPKIEFVTAAEIYDPARQTKLRRFLDLRAAG